MAISLSDSERLLSFAGSIAAGLLLLRIASEGLIRRYRYFAFYLACLLGEAVVLATVPPCTDSYFYAFVIVDVLQVCAQVVIIVELYSRVVADYPGIARVARQVLRFAFAAAAVISVGFAAVTLPADADMLASLGHYLIFSRVMAFTVLTFFFILLAFLLWFPVRLTRNLTAYAFGLSVYFATRGVERFAGNAAVESGVVYSNVALLVILGCLIFWIVLLNRRGETVSVTVGHPWRPEEGRALIHRLESLNATLVRASRK